MKLRILKTSLALGASVLIGGCVGTTRQQTSGPPVVVAGPTPIGAAPAGPAPSPFPVAGQPTYGPPPGQIVAPPPSGYPPNPVPIAPCPNCQNGSTPMPAPPPPPQGGVIIQQPMR